MTREELDEIKRHFDIVAENVALQVQQVAEGHQVLVAGQARIVGHIDQIEAGQGRILGRIDQLEAGQERILGRIDQLETGQAQILGRVDQLEAGQGRILGRIDQLEAELKAMLKFSFAELDRRVSVLEEALAAIRARVERLETRQN